MAEDSRNPQVRQGSKGIEPHPLAAVLAPGGEAPLHGTTVLSGYVGVSTDENVVRLHPNLDFTLYVEVPKGLIRANQPLENDTINLWIDSSARVQFGIAQTLEVEAGFLSGAFTDVYLKAAGAAVAARGRTPLLRQVQDPFGHLWWPPFSQDCWITGLWPFC